MMTQPDLFGTPTAAVYVVPHDIAVNTLRKTLATLTAASRWPWDPDEGRPHGPHRAQAAGRPAVG